LADFPSDLITIDVLQVELEETEDNSDDTVLLFSDSLVEDSDRLFKLHDELRIDHLNSEEKVSLINICEEYNEVFLLPGHKLTLSTAAEHTTPTPTIDPTRGINTKPYRIPEIHRDEVQKQTEQMLRDRVIVPITSPWKSPILVVPKKADDSGEKKCRIVVDFRKLNDVTIGDSFPIPVISEILDTLGKSKYFSTIDCASGFLQSPCKIRRSNQNCVWHKRRALSVKRMPVDLKGGPATFQRLMTTVLSGIQRIKFLVYLDNVVFMEKI
jgi:hypothetical protein